MIRKNFIFLLLFFVFHAYGQRDSKEFTKLLNTSVYLKNHIGGINKDTPLFKASFRNYDFLIESKEDLLNVLEDSSISGVTIYIPGELEINLTGNTKLSLPNNVTIFGDRGRNGSKGARIYTTDSGVFPLFDVHDNVVISGLRIEGGDKDIYFQNRKIEGENSSKLNTYRDRVSKGIDFLGSNNKIINCEISGWTFSAVVVSKGSKNNTISYSFFHHNRRVGLGYGVMVNGGEVEIFGCLFDYNRHDIAGSGIKGSAYRVHHNIFLSNTYTDSIDMHGGHDRKDSTDIAGDYMYIYYNYFERKFNKGKVFMLRGTPQYDSYTSNNKVVLFDIPENYSIKEEDFFMQKNSKGNYKTKDNTIITR